MKSTIIKSLIAITAVATAWQASAMDVVTLTDGSTMAGQIYQRDDDGAVYLNLPDGNKRYLFANEIASISQNTEPFRYVKPSYTPRDYTRKASGPRKPTGLSFRLSYEQHMPGKVKDNLAYDDVNESYKYEYFDNGPGVSLGLYYTRPIWRGIFIEPGVELYYSQYKSKIENEHKQHQLGARIPLMVGYMYDFSPKIQARVFTGPSFDFNIAHNSESDMEFKRFYTDWTIGIGATFFKKLYLGLGYTIGMTSRIKAIEGYYGEDASTSMEMKVSRLQVSLGINF